MRGRGQAQIIVGPFRQRRHRHLAIIFVAMARVHIFDGGHQPVFMPVIGADLIEEGEQIASRAYRRTAGAEQDARCQRGHQADDMLFRPDRRHVLLVAQQPGLFERGEIQFRPLPFIGGKRQQWRGGVIRLQDGGAQIARLLRLEFDKFGPRHGRGGSDDMEAERDERDLVLARHGAILLVKADKIELVERAARGRHDLAHLVLHRFPPFAQSALSSIEERREVGELVVHPVLKRAEGTIRHFLEARIGADVDGEAAKAVSGLIEKEARCQQLPVGIGDRFQVDEGHTGVIAALRALRNTPHIGEEFEEFEAIDILVVIEFRHADLEIGIGRVEVRDILERDGIGRLITRQYDTRPTHADRDFRLDAPFDEETIGFDRLRPIGIGDLQIVKAVRRARKIEGRDDRAAVDHLPGHRLEFGNARPRQFEDRILVEARALDRGRHIAAVAAGIGLYAGDHHRHQIGDQPHRATVVRAAIAPHHHIIDARLRIRDDRGQFLRQWSGIGRIEQRRCRYIVMPHEHFVDRPLVIGGYAQPQRLFCRHDDTVEPLLPRLEIDRQGDSERQRLNRDAGGVGGSGDVVRLAHILEQLIARVGPHDDAIVARRRTGQRRIQAQRIALVRQQGACEIGASQKLVAYVPGRIAREIDRIAPAARRGHCALVRHRPADRDGIARLLIVGRDNIGDLYVGGRWQLDNHRHVAAADIVALVGFKQAARGVIARRIGHHENIIGFGAQVARHNEILDDGIGAASVQPPCVADRAQETIRCQVKKRIAGKIDKVVPLRLQGRCRAARIGDAIFHAERLSTGRAQGHAERGNLKVWRGVGRERNRLHGEVVALPCIFLDLAVDLPAHAGQTRRQRAFGVAGLLQARIRSRNDIKFALQLERQADGDFRNIGFAGIEYADMRVFGADDDARRRFPRHQPVAFIQRGVERQIDPVDPAILSRRAGADIFDAEADFDRATRRQRVRQRQFGNLEVRFAIDDREFRLGNRAGRQLEHELPENIVP